ncbi:GNAT family N-acetyltransferase [Enterovibrio coralii]|uniref:N-acetyltransferase domain-containing protein n=1 Tax=Enterovibrio coralii TaxID=294935 RepID=A0A135I2F2_9GAMM|nr:GNAT family N-acetyltransferase [Enterovibrio coralii]KXF79630.1 hypothetical protein ATN88_15205 [Enterovibrio coralii]
MYQGQLKPVRPEQRPQFSALMTAAFLGDPAARYLWQDAHQFLSVFPEYSLLYQGTAIEDGTAWATEDFSAAIAWLAPGRLPDADKIKTLALDTCTPDVKEDTLRFFDELDAYFPDEPCWYLPLVGVDPAFMGNGRGHFLMEQSLAVVDESGLPAYLESSNPRNVDFYRQFGFEPLATVSLGGRELSTPMYRPAKQETGLR